MEDEGEIASKGDTDRVTRIVQTTRLGAPINGGVNSQTGDMILLIDGPPIDGQPGVRHRFELPFDQSGPALEILERAAGDAAKWAAAREKGVEQGGIVPMDLRPRDTEFVMLGEDMESGRPLLVVRLVGGHQFSFLLDQKIVEQIRVREQPVARASGQADPWATVAEDIEWLGKEWCTLYQPPSNAELRRGSAALRRLLVENALGHAWRKFGFEKQPHVSGPDVMALLLHYGTEPRHVVSLIAGGATLNGIQTSMLGCARAFNESTGVSADADEGFAVATFHVSRDARQPATESEVDDMVERLSPLSNYLRAPGAIRLGQTISRLDIVKYFANSAGGVHLEHTPKSPEGAGDIDKAVRDDLLQALQQAVMTDTMDGLHFELLSIGQAIGRSADMHALVKAIRVGRASA